VNYYATSSPALYHNSPPAALKFNLGVTAGFKAINGYFYYAEFRYGDDAFMGTEDEVREYVDALPIPMFFWWFPEEHEQVGDSTYFDKWGSANYQEFDEYDGAFEWATYGWAITDGTLSEWNEFFRLTINNDPVGDVEYLGDRSLVGFIYVTGGKEYLYFSVYSYGFTSDYDSTNEYYKVDCTGYL
jgi:hypothetical protein